MLIIEIMWMKIMKVVCQVEITITAATTIIIISTFQVAF